MTDQELIRLLRTEKRHKAFVRLYKYYKPIEKYIRANSGTRHEANDVFQETLIIFYRKIEDPAFALTASIDTYLYSVARFVWSNELRKKAGRPSVATDEIADVFDKDEYDPARENQFSLAETALSQVTEACRQLLALFYVDLLSMADIAQKLGFSSEQSAKTQKYKCLEKARDVYQQLATSNNSQL